MLGTGLNPYSIGRYFAGIENSLVEYSSLGSLNPYSIGRYFAGNMTTIEMVAKAAVLILILLEGTLLENRFHDKRAKTVVLILILLEGTLLGPAKKSIAILTQRS